MHTEIDECYKEISRKFDKVVLIGDFNLESINDWNNSSSSNKIHNLYIETFQDLGFEQFINEPTHIKGNILDLLLTNRPGLLSNINVQENGVCFSDHASIFFTLNQNVPRKKPTKRKLYNFKKANWVGLNHMLRCINWSNLFYGKDIHSAWNLFKSKLDQCIRVNIPIICIKSKYQPPWFDCEMHKLCIHKEKLRSLAKKSGKEDDINKYYDSRKEFRKKAKEKMNAFIADDPFDNESIIKKKFWSHVKSINKTARIPETVFYRENFCHNPKDNCELFNNYFADQFSKKSSYHTAINFKNDSNYSYNISEVKVYNLLNNIKPTKLQGLIIYMVKYLQIVRLV